MAEITEEDWNIPECKYEYLDHTADVQVIFLCEDGEIPSDIFKDSKNEFDCRNQDECLHLPDVYQGFGFCNTNYRFGYRLHAWGDTLEEAFEQCANAMFGYMTEIEYVEMLDTQDIEAEGHDIDSLLFHFLDEFLFLFCAEPFFIAKKVKIIEFDRENFKIKARGFGETFQLGKHPQGTEVKAITYSNMQVHENEGKCEVFVIIDI